jgi:hypothetical protein
VTKVLHKATFRRLFAVAVMLGVLAATSPAASLAENVGGGP